MAAAVKKLSRKDIARILNVDVGGEFRLSDGEFQYVRDCCAQNDIFPTTNRDEQADYIMELLEEFDAEPES